MSVSLWFTLLTVLIAVPSAIASTLQLIEWHNCTKASGKISNQIVSTNWRASLLEARFCSIQLP